jgi:HlyD family secretion protein
MPLQPSDLSSRRSRGNRRRVLRWVKRGLLGIVGLAILAAIVYAWLPKPVTVDTATARRTSLAVEVSEEGRTRVRNRFVVSAAITGNLARVEVEPGDRVDEGGVVARIAPPAPALLDERTRQEAQARLAAARALVERTQTAIARAELARDNARLEAERSRVLADRGAIAVAERDRAELTEQLAERDLAAARAERASAAAEVAAARAVLGLDAGARPASARARTARARTARPVEVTSPAAGVILRVLRDSEGPVAAGTPLLELGDPRALEIVVDVLSGDAARIRPGMPVSIEAWGGDPPLSGVVRQVEPSAFTRISALGVEEQRVRVIVALDEPPPSLGDGFRVEARIFTWRGEDVLAIPASAVFRHQGRWAVYVIEAGRARLRPVELGHRGRLDVQVVRGVADGQALVLYPGDRIRDGVRVTPR